MINKAIHPPVKWVTGKYDTEYAFWVEGEKAYLSFQGSLSLTDWIFNLLFFPIFRKYFFHYGMYKKYEVISVEIERFINENQHKEIVFLGHSQGAGIALIAFILMQKNYSYVKMRAILFGCPMILNLISIFSLNSLKENIKLYEVRSDIVPKLIPWYFKLGKVIKIGPKKMWSVKDHYPSVYRKYYKEE